MKIVKILPIVALISAFVITSCKKHDDEQENLNTLKLTIGGKAFTWTDTDGVGSGNAPKIDTIKLSPNAAAADFTVDISDASVTPAKDYTAEIVSESDAHLFVFTPTGANLTVSGLSNDKNGKGFGQSGKMATGAASTGSLRIVLKHDADKGSANPANTGETDLDVSFPVVIK
jgi:hypothetical protein